MTMRRYSRTVAAMGLVVLAAAGTAATAAAQGHAPSHGMMPQHSSMADTSGMMTSVHHLLAMGYHKTVMTFATLLRTDVARSRALNLDLARPAVAEMRRGVDKLRQHHEALARMHRGTTTPMPMMRDETMGHLQDMESFVAGLELELRANPLSPEQVLDKLDAVLEHCAGMMK